MTLYCLEMRSTQDFSDVRFRDYTTSVARAERFRTVPKIHFTDSGHGVVPVVTVHPGGRLRRPKFVNTLADYVRRHTSSVEASSRGRRRSISDQQGGRRDG